MYSSLLHRSIKAENAHLSNTFDENNIRVINVTYEPISEADLGVLNQSKIPSSINFEVKNKLFLYKKIV